MYVLKTSALLNFLVRGLDIKYFLLVIILGFAIQAFAEEEVPTIAPYELVQNPFLFKNKKVKLDPFSIPMSLYSGGEIHQLFDPSLGISGLQFNKMVDEHVAVYDIRFISNDSLLVVFPEAPIFRSPDGPLSYRSLWYVQPIGQMEVLTSSNETFLLPAVKFLGYEAEAEKKSKI